MLSEAQLKEARLAHRGHSTSKTFTPWKDFDVIEYVTRKYGKTLLKEDRFIISKVIETVQKLDIKPGSLQTVADVGAGPNLYPAMLFAPLVKSKSDGGQIDLIEYSQANRAYVESILHGDGKPLVPESVWRKFEELMARESDLWEHALNGVKEKARVVAGDIFELPTDYYDAISSYFVSESITEDMATCKKAVDSLINATKKDGFLMIAHMLGTQAWPAGEGTQFPAVPITVEDLHKMYDTKTKVEIFETGAKPDDPKGHYGMALVVGVKL